MQKSAQANIQHHYEYFLLLFLAATIYIDAGETSHVWVSDLICSFQANLYAHLYLPMKPAE